MNYRRITSPLFLIICLFTTLPNCYGQDINIGIRDSVYSDILKEKRGVSIYFPPSYYYKTYRKYPVLYILDGDYNFRYVAGILELQAGIAENIPEMILVGISGNGSTEYRRNCKPEIAGVKDSGNAGDVLEFMEKELIPYMDENYKTLDFKILSGHSVGGLFVINAALERPKLFDAYIAISPALWWEDNAINKIAESKYATVKSLGTNVYVSLADEKGMGVQEFLKITGPEFKFKQFENENHNSVGAPTYEWALKDIFKDWRIEKMYFDSAKGLAAYQKQSSAAYPVALPISDGVLYNSVVYFLKDKSKELEKIRAIISADYPDSDAYFTSLLGTEAIKNKDYKKAEELVKQGLEIHPNSFELHEKLAKAYLYQDEITKSREEVKTAIALAQKQKVRQWRIAEIGD